MHHHSHHSLWSSHEKKELELHKETGQFVPHVGDHSWLFILNWEKYLKKRLIFPENLLKYPIRRGRSEAGILYMYIPNFHRVEILMSPSSAGHSWEAFFLKTQILKSPYLYFPSDFLCSCRWESTYSGMSPSAPLEGTFMLGNSLCPVPCP